MAGIIGATGVVFVVNGGVKEVPGEVDDEEGEEGFERNKTLTGVVKLLG